MILIADSGSTKTDWRLITGKKIRSLSTMGINPYHSSEKEIAAELQKLDLEGDERNILEIYFYGSGVANEEMKDIIRRSLQKRIGVHPYIQVNDDLLGVARALFQEKSGIACILGTGSNSGLYLEDFISDKVPAMGYLLGDEGSGTDIGKRLVNALHKRSLGKDLKDAIIAEEGLSMDQILENVYKKPHANRYLASLTRVAAKHIEDPQIREIIAGAFVDFIDKNIAKYSNYSNMNIGFAGSVAFHFKDILLDVLEKYQMKNIKIIAAPIEGLVEYHQKMQAVKMNSSASITEAASRYDNLDKMSVNELLARLVRNYLAIHPLH